MRAEDQRGGGSIATQRPYELLRDGARISVIGHPCLFRQGVEAQPIEQRPTEAADNAGLREMSMRVNEAGKNQRATPIGDRGFAMRGANRCVIPDRKNAAIGDRQSAIVVALKRAIFGEWVARCVQNHPAKQFDAVHAPATPDQKRVNVDAVTLMRAFSIVALLPLAVAMAADSPTIEPKDLAPRLGKSPQIAIFQVGVGYQYRANHIPGAVYAGPGSRPDGIDLLKSAAAKLPRDREIVIYCGCCPWDKCPNIKPAIEVLKGMGFTKVTALHIPTTFKADWIDQAYPVEHSDAK